MTAIFFIIAIVLSMDVTARPVVSALAEKNCRRHTLSVINNAVTQAISESDICPSNIVDIKYNNIGIISSVETNSTDLSLLQSDIALSVNKALKESEGTVSIPAGTFTGVYFLSGKGPDVDFDITSTGYSSVSVASVFSDAGINQTRHEIVIEVTAESTAVIPLYTESYEVSQKYVVCDTIVVGDIPESYTFITGDDRDNVSMINDYKAENLLT